MSTSRDARFLAASSRTAPRSSTPARPLVVEGRQRHVDDPAPPVLDALDRGDDAPGETRRKVIKPHPHLTHGKP